jgi:hypothetical protein
MAEKKIVSISHTNRTGPFGGKYEETHVTTSDGEVGKYSHNENNGGKSRLSKSERVSKAIKNLD